MTGPTSHFSTSVRDIGRRCLVSNCAPSRFKEKPVAPVKPKRQTLERRLKKLESEAAELREQLKNLATEG